MMTATCGVGVGMAVCCALGLVVTSEKEGNTLSVFLLPVPSDCDGAAGAGTVSVCEPDLKSLPVAGSDSRCQWQRLWTLGGTSSPAPMQFKFSNASGG
jgi:hypothetical protein